MAWLILSNKLQNNQKPATYLIPTQTKIWNFPSFPTDSVAWLILSNKLQNNQKPATYLIPTQTKIWNFPSFPTDSVAWLILSNKLQNNQKPAFSLSDSGRLTSPSSILSRCVFTFSVKNTIIVPMHLQGSYRQDCVNFKDFSKTFLLFSRTHNGERTKAHWDKSPLGQKPTGQYPTGQKPTA